MELNVKNIVFGFSPSKKILNGISLYSNENKTIAIVGASGCGKSTFLRLLCGLIQKTKGNLFEGSISVDGISPAEYTKKAMVGFMFQDATLFPNLTVKENIVLPLRFRKESIEKRVEKMLETVGLKDFQSYLPQELSGGMKTRVALARTFITQPTLLLLDEPFSALDIRWKFLLYRELEDLRQSYSPTIVIVTHDIQEALYLSNHILVFGRDGNIVKEICIDKPLPRVFDVDSIKDLQTEYLEIQHLIINN